jgi:hypothetical protein
MANGPIGIVSAAVYPIPRPDLPHLAVLFDPRGKISAAIPMAEQEAYAHVEQAMQKAATLLTGCARSWRWC